MTGLSALHVFLIQSGLINSCAFLGVRLSTGAKSERFHEFFMARGDVIFFMSAAVRVSALLLIRLASRFICCILHGLSGVFPTVLRSRFQRKYDGSAEPLVREQCLPRLVSQSNWSMVCDTGSRVIDDDCFVVKVAVSLSPCCEFTQASQKFFFCASSLVTNPKQRASFHHMIEQTFSCVDVVCLGF